MLFLSCSKGICTNYFSCSINFFLSFGWCDLVWGIQLLHFCFILIMMFLVLLRVLSSLSMSNDDFSRNCTRRMAIKCWMWRSNAGCGIRILPPSSIVLVPQICKISTYYFNDDFSIFRAGLHTQIKSSCSLPLKYPDQPCVHELLPPVVAVPGRPFFALLNGPETPCGTPPIQAQ